MRLRVGSVRRLLLDTPRNVMVAYSLFRDDRVPAGPKAALLGGLGLIVSPVDVPAWIPVVGELDIFALTTLALRVFIDACPEELVREHEEAAKRGDSIFHHDARRVARRMRERAIEAANETIARWRERRRTRADRDGSSSGRIGA